MNHHTGHFICTFCENFFYSENKTISDDRSKDTHNILIKNKIVGLPISAWSMLIRTILYFQSLSLQVATLDKLYLGSRRPCVKL